ncbi:hypothetical protein CERSUDRAFT_114774 [Gelatoporia subvermispora B]|uniref:Nucleoporin Nup54 alpha-helical domain-containing protein n=1 Tax=Ceriporiopsis subvermispora (strain B) TaxID=914234 RepID=M2QXK3_CERS8|nr:hypothetical protein CERSUDRAFT_114774 [Gelatoporia subvermispora B]
MFGAFNNPANSNQTQQQGGSSGNATGGNLFGGFGSNTNNSQPATGSSLFGNQTQQQPSGSSLFGGANTNQSQPAGPTGTGLFINTQNQQQQGAGGGLFGNAATGTQGTAGGGLFGNASTTQPASGGLFGGQANTNANAATTGASLFGNNSNTNTNTTGGLFGGGNTGTSGGSSLFGNTANNTTNAPGTGLFGNTGGSNLFANTNTGQPGGSLFGNTSSNTAGGTAGGGLFGASQAGTSSNPLFGNTQTQQQGPGSSLFGQTQTQPAQGSSLFGSFGQTQNAPPGASNLGNSTFTGSTLLGQNPNLFGSKAPTAPPPPQADPQAQFTALMQRIESVAQAWNPSSPQCRFQHYFYNLVDPNQVHLYGRPANATNDALWQKAVRENPDSKCLVPVIANGFDDLQQRVEAQSKQAAAHQERLKELHTRIGALTQRHQLSNASRLQRAQALQTQLVHRTLKLIQHLHLLIPTLRSSAIRPEEEELRTALEEIDQEIRRPGGTGSLRGKLNELWALVGAVNAARERDRRTGGVEWAVVDEDGLNQLAQILADEQAGIAHFTKILQKDLKDIAVIKGENVREEEPDNLLKSTSTLLGTSVYS